MDLPLEHIDPSYIRPLTVECVQHVAESSGVHPDILFAIAMVEGGEVGKVSPANKNGSQDIGFMQINSIHLPRLKKMGVTAQQLRDDGCINFKVAAWRVASVTNNRTNLSDPDSYLQSIAAYHSYTEEHNRAYAKKLNKAFELMYSQD